MYHPTHIAKLSAAQISKILNGHRVRVKHGNHHVLHLSHEQHKKVMSAHKKGASSTIQFDPFQQQMANHQSLRHGHSHVHAHGSGNELLHESSSFHAHHGRGGKGKRSHRGRGPFDIFKSVVKAVAPVAINEGGKFLQNKIEGWGEGVHHNHSHKKRGCGGRTRKHKKGGDIGSDILHVAEQVAPYALTLMMGLGEGTQHRHRHHSHGSSLMPAGY